MAEHKIVILELVSDTPLLQSSFKVYIYYKDRIEKVERVRHGS